EGPHEPRERSERGEAGPLAHVPEITCEANPETVTIAKLRTMREASVNRVSIGAQSFSESELALLGRGHSPELTEAAVEAAREAGFEHLSLDLIYALPGQTVEDWRRTLLRALALEPEHLSAYGLELADGTPLHARWEAGEIAPVADTEHLAMRELTRELCAEAGLQRYEISNYARPGCECAHSITYWRNEPYIGFGAGAWSYLDGVRSANLREPAAYCAATEAGGSPREFAERLDPDDALAETLMMGLRMTAGLSLEALELRFGEERLQRLLARAAPLVEIGLLEVRNGHLRLTPEGEPLHGEVCVRLA
ncbi:MAG TPA: coproporphyrinogen III oxidase, partial [Armatimonadetes bacterium]|nr:coproporphyrinogen III oxidase [Armatimonadota bacterium]